MLPTYFLPSLGGAPPSRAGGAAASRGALASGRLASAGMPPSRSTGGVGPTLASRPSAGRPESTLPPLLVASRWPAASGASGRRASEAGDTPVSEDTAAASSPPAGSSDTSSGSSPHAASAQAQASSESRDRMARSARARADAGWRAGMGQDVHAARRFGSRPSA